MNDSVKKIAISKFKRGQVDYRETASFDDLSELIKQEILKRTNLQTEECVIVRYLSEKKWLLISLSSLFIKLEDSCEKIDYNIIVSMQPNINLHLLNKTNKFTYSDSLIIITKTEDHKVVYLEPGTVGVLIGVIKYLASL